MKENSAPPALDSWAPVVAGFHHDIVEMVGSFQIFMRSCVGQIYPAVIVSVACSFTPAPPPFDRRNGNFRLGLGYVVTPVENLQQPPHADRATAVPLPFEENSA